jgi:hypothetical protein
LKPKRVSRDKIARALGYHTGQHAIQEPRRAALYRGHRG